MSLIVGGGAGALPAVAMPTGAVVFHEAHYGLAVTFHAVTEHAGAPCIGAGRAMTHGDAEVLLAALKGEPSGTREWIAPELLAQGDRFLAWHIPGRVRPMWFSSGGKRIRLEVPWPNLVFSATDGAIRLAALATRGRPRLGTRLFHAPLMNVYADGVVCLGSAKVGEMHGTGSIAPCEAAIFDSLFTHGNFRGNLARGQRKGETSDAEHLRFWKRLASERLPVFPTDALVPMKTTLGAFLELS